MTRRARLEWALRLFEQLRFERLAAKPRRNWTTDDLEPWQRNVRTPRTWKDLTVRRRMK